MAQPVAKMSNSEMTFDANGSNKEAPFVARRRIGFIGCGKMALAIAKGWIESGACSAGEIVVSSPNLLPNRIKFQELGCAVTSSNIEVVKQSEVVVIATKPYAVEKVLREASNEAANALIISIAAGVTLDSMQNAFSVSASSQSSIRLIRVVPNMPMQLGPGWGACCIACGPNISAKDAEFCQKLFSSVAGVCINVPESQLNVASALIGSGPAYIFILIESLADAAVMDGLPRETAQKLAAQMVLGSAKMLCSNEGGKNSAPLPACVLKDQICSPGGTTIAGLYALEKGGYRAAIMSAIHAATERAFEMGKK